MPLAAMLSGRVDRSVAAGIDANGGGRVRTGQKTAGPSTALRSGRDDRSVAAGIDANGGSV
jgi:hypothetical protein